MGHTGEEVAYRGYILTRMSELLTGRWCIWAAVLLSSGLFGLAHTEQGAVGVALAFIDGFAFALRLRTGTLWAAILATDS
ncbi:MAG TPA: CPBP family intramembrane glutamic endopeptidase [Acidimicrobiia bacterium]|nr:CPBP family intramembrane glutamic endopeptidase [Acidimicrobiia bacterium]